MKKFYKFISSLLIFSLLTFNFSQTKVSANPAAFAIAPITLDFSAAGASVVAAAPYVAAFAAVCIGLGIAYENKDQIQSAFQGAYNYAKSTGINILDYFSQVDDKVIVSQDGFSFLQDYVRTYKISPSSISTSGVVFETIIPKSFPGEPCQTINVDFPLESNTNYSFKLYSTEWGALTGTIAFGNSIIDLRFDTVASGGKPLIINTTTNTLEWWGPYSYLHDIFTEMSFPATGVMNIVNTDYDPQSICVERTLGENIGDLTNTTDDVLPVNPSISGSQDISISIPSDLTWDKVIGKDYTQSIPISDVVDTDVPGDIPGDTTEDPDYTVPNDSVPTLDFSPLQLSLSDKFPFCIPFDLVNGIKTFVSSSEAPTFTVTFPSLYGMQKGSFDIDFANFDKIVKILRFFILLTFLYQLIKITRDMVRG